MKLFFFIGVFLLFIPVALLAQEPSEVYFHDFRALDFKKEQIHIIKGNWYFYWNHLISPSQDKNLKLDSIKVRVAGNSSWTTFNSALPSFGYGTYTTKLLLPKNHPPLSLEIPKINSSCRLWIDNNMVFESGRVGQNKKTTKHHRTSTLIPIQTNSDTLEITIQVANFYHRNGGIISPLILGDTQYMWKMERLETISDMILIGSLIFLGLILLILYFAYWGYDKAILYFSIFSICWGYRSLSDNYEILPSLFESLPWVVHVKIEYFSLFLGSFTGFLFLLEIFKGSFNVYFTKIALSSFGLIALINLFGNGYLQSYLLTAYFVISSTIMFYMVYIIITSKQNIQAYFALTGILIGVIVLIYHIYSFNILGEANNIWINIGYLFAFMMNSLLLGKRFSVTFFKLNMLQKETQLQNQKIARQAQLIHRTNDQLEEKVKIRTEEIEKVLKELKERNNDLEQFNYIVSHNMRAPVSNIIGLVNLYNKQDTSDPFNEITINKLDESINAIDQVLKDLTSILEAKHYVERPLEKVYFKELIKEIKKSISKEIELSELKLDLDFQVESIQSNGAYWHSIFINLISNSIKYKKPQEPAYIKITSKKESNKIKIIFEDKGLGIDLIENGNDIFGLYKRFHNHVDGKGMGLYMIKTQIQSLNGNIEIDSKPNIGTKFTITI